MVKFAENPVQDKERNSAPETPVEGSGTSTSDGGQNGKDKAGLRKEDDTQKKRRRRNKPKNAADGRPMKKTRRNSLSKAPRDPRDAASPIISPAPDTRSQSPVIDFDGLSRPSKAYHYYHSRLENCR